MNGLLHAVWDYGVVFVLVLTVVVFVHEFGHFIVARWCGVKVETFSIGFGTELFGWTVRSGTRWRLSLLPLGGYVKMFGDADPSSTPDLVRDYTPAERAVAFHFKSVGQRAAIIAAGPLANFIFGIVALAILLMVSGELWTLPVVNEVQADSAAAEAGLLSGDRIVEANGTVVQRFQDLQRIVRVEIGEPLALAVMRNGTRINVLAHPKIREMTDIFGNVEKVPVLGITASPEATERVVFKPISAFREAFSEIGDMVTTTYIGIGQIIVGRRSSDELGGPLRIAKGIGQAAKLGAASVAYYAIVLSVNLGFINLVPIPLLDGGRLLFIGFEAALRRPLGARVQEYGFRLGLFLVFALMLFVTRNDLADLRVWEYLKSIIS